MVKETGRLPFIRKRVHTGQNCRRAQKTKLFPTAISYKYGRLLQLHTLSTQRSFPLRVWDAVLIVLRYCLILKNEFFISIIWTTDIKKFVYKKYLYQEIDFLISDDHFLISNSKCWCQKLIFWYQKSYFWYQEFKLLIYWFQKL